MDNYHLNSLNKILTKKNILSTINELELFYRCRKELNLYQLNDLHIDVKKIKRFLAANVCKLNLHYNIHYYKHLQKMEYELIKLCFIKVNEQ